LAKLLAWLCVLKTYPLLPPTSHTPFRLTNFSAFSENSTFEFLTRFCFNRFGVPLVSNPSLRCFLHTICQRFCQTSEPCPNPMVFLLFNGQWREGAGWDEGGSMFEHGFLHKARPNYTFQPFTLQRKVHSRCWKSPLVKTKYTAGPHRRWRRWLQALGLFYKKNMPNNNTAYSICKINFSFISFLWVEQWSGGADVDSTHALAFSTTDTLKCVCTLCTVQAVLDSSGYRGTGGWCEFCGF
jgi:hypothetical protein